MTDNRANPSRTRAIALAAVLGVACGFAAQPAIAQQNSDLEACVAIADNVDRLACFDAAMARRAAAVASGESAPAAPTAPAAPRTAAPAQPSAPVQPGQPPAPPSDDYVVLPRAEAEELRRRAGADERALKREPYESEIVRVFITGYNTRNVELENGEVWRELKDAVGMKPRAGQSARLAPASVGSWTIQYGGRSAKFKVRRTN